MLKRSRDFQITLLLDFGTRILTDEHGFFNAKSPGRQENKLNFVSLRLCALALEKKRQVTKTLRRQENKANFASLRLCALALEKKRQVTKAQRC
ncbi:MAG: hypothetical protein U9R05_01840 [Chloroflexota bacterium]|nr:hypothetical protein [Chloroflexota bacterium]